MEFAPSAELLLASQMAHDASERGSIAGLALTASGASADRPRILWPDPAARDPSPARAPAVADPACREPPADASFAPHGLAAGAPRSDGAVPVAVVVHGARESVELFWLVGTGARARLRWAGCAPLPPDTSANDVVFGPGDALTATNYQPTLEGLRGALYSIAGGLGRPTGDVQERRPGSGWAPLPGSEGANPNGVMLDGGRVLFAQTGAGSVVVLDPDSPGSRREIAIDGYPDNLSRASDGRILVATHRSGLAFLRCQLGDRPCRAPWSLFEIDPETLGSRELLRHAGETVGGVASVAEAHGRLYFGAVYDDRIGVWQPPHSR